MTKSGRYRFYVQSPLEAGTQVTLSERVSTQIFRVLRLRIGDVILLFDGGGLEREAKIVEAGRKSVIAEISSNSARGVVPKPPRLHLGQALLKSDKFDLVVQKATELGVSTVTAVENERCVVSLPVDRAGARLERWERIAIEALEQSERADFVLVEGPTTFADMVSESMSELKLIAAERSCSQQLWDFIVPDLRDVTILVGPEGGYTDRELEIADRAGFQEVSLGPTILRSETAGIATIAMIRALAGRLASTRTNETDV
jgi:16S rRNA (uracil1498-N3)-methyltransferase